MCYTIFKMNLEKSLQRQKEFIKLREGGLTYSQIAKIFDITRQRVHQVVNQKFSGREPDPFWFNKKKWQKEGRERVRMLVRKRDDFKCQDCGKRWKDGERSFDVHHLNGLCGKKSRGYDSIKDMDILITLCHKCHFNRPEHKSKKT